MINNSKLVFDAKTNTYLPKEEYEYYSKHERFLEGDNLTLEEKKKYLKVICDFEVHFPLEENFFPTQAFDIRMPNGRLYKQYLINSNQDYKTCINELIEENLWGHALEVSYGMRKNVRENKMIEVENNPFLIDNSNKEEKGN